jgi:hypothetical protein
VADVVDTNLAQDLVLVVVPNSGVRSVLTYYLTRWRVPFVQGATFDEASRQLLTYRKCAPHTEANIPAEVYLREPTIYVVDIDKAIIPSNVLSLESVRYIMVCSDAHRRHLKDKLEPPYSDLTQYTLLNKPIKRETFWSALLARKFKLEHSGSHVLDRTLQVFASGRRLGAWSSSTLQSSNSAPSEPASSAPALVSSSPASTTSATDAPSATRTQSSSKRDKAAESKGNTRKGSMQSQVSGVSKSKSSLDELTDLPKIRVLVAEDNAINIQVTILLFLCS